MLGAGFDTRAYRLARRSDIPVFEVDLPENITRKRAVVQRAVGAVPPSVHLVPVDFENDDLAAKLVEQGYRSDARTFFIWEGVTQYLTEAAARATLEHLRDAASGSRLVFTYIRKDFLDGTNMFGAETLYRRFRVRQQMWDFGIQPDNVSAFVAGYGWRLVEQAGPDYIERNYVRPAGRDPHRVTDRVDRIRGESVARPANSRRNCIPSGLYSHFFCWNTVSRLTGERDQISMTVGTIIG